MPQNIMPMWTKQKVLQKLHEDPRFENLFDEGKGKYECAYIIDGIQVKLFYTVSGEVEIWLLSTHQLYSIGKDIQSFVSLANEICVNITKSKGGNNV